MAHAQTKHHDYHLVDPSPWPFMGAMAALAFTIGLVMWFRGITSLVAIAGIIGIFYVMIGWWRDVINEAEHQGHHTKVVQLHLRYGMILFIASEVMFFAAWFWAFFDASLFDPQQRLPELFCGFARREEEGPTPYPVACSPQAWATVVPFALLEATLGLRVTADRREVAFENPSLPSFLPEVRLQNLTVADGTIDLVLQRYRRSVGIEILRRKGEVRVMSAK